MPRSNDAIEKRLASLTRELSLLEARVDGLSAKLASLESARHDMLQSASLTAASPKPDSGAPSSDPPELQADKLWSWVGRSSLLPRIAAICFMLVMALILRTLTDTGIIGKETGSFIGMTYAAGLIAWGYRLLSRQSRLGAVFPVCGALLLYIIVLETHARFESVSSLAAYVILFITLVALNGIAMRFNLAGLNCLAILGTSCIAVALDFPRPHFPSLILLLSAANIIAFTSSSREPRCGWSRWILFAITLLVWLLWTIKLRVPLERQNEVAATLSLSWFLPLLLLQAAGFMAMPVRRAFGNGRMHLFDMALPTLNVLWAYGAAWLVVDPWMGRAQWLGIAGVAMAAIHFGTAAWLYRKNKTGSPAICAFTVAGATLLVLAFPTATDSILSALLVWAAVAYGLARLSEACEIGGIRLTSYLLQVMACGFGVLAGVFSVRTPAPFAGLTAAGALAMTSGLQYRWCRKNPLTCSAGFFRTIDPVDRSAVVLLLAALVNGYAMLQLGAHMTLSALMNDIANAFLGAQSTLVNMGAIAVMVLALAEKNKEIMATAILVAFVGAVKVFGYDLFAAHGIPLVVSVFSFGAMAAVGSIVLSRWQHPPLPSLNK